MSLNITGILIDSKPNFEIDFKLKKFEISKIENLSPKKLSITFINNTTLILQDNILFKNVNEEKELTFLEKDVVELFPENNIWIFVLNDTIDFWGFSRIQEGQKRRSKFVGQGRPFLDYGNLHSVEQKLYEDYSKILLSDPNIKEVFNKNFGNLDEIERKKKFLMFKDLLQEKSNISNDFPYLSGKMESYYMEMVLETVTKKRIIDLLEMEFIIFNKSKFNFETESLNDYLLTAWKNF